MYSKIKTKTSSTFRDKQEKINLLILNLYGGQNLSKKKMLNMVDLKFTLSISGKTTQSPGRGARAKQNGYDLYSGLCNLQKILKLRIV